jgi:NCS1 family nucleobase:cation symporter-1
MPLYSSVGMLAKPSAWILDPAPSSFAPSNNWSNQDMDPVPVEKRTWTTWNYVVC